MLDKKQELPKWFDGKCYTHGDTVENRFSGEKYELSAAELSMYDFIMGATMVMEMGVSRSGLFKDLTRGLNWFRKTNPEAYMVLLD